MKKKRTPTPRHRALTAAYSRAKTELVREFPEDFKRIYDKEVKRAGIVRAMVKVGP